MTIPHAKTYEFDSDTQPILAKIDVKAPDHFSSYTLSDDFVTKPSLMIVPDKRRGIGLKIIIPAAIAFISTAGMATFFLAWLYSHKTQTNHEIWRDRAFLLNEGTKLEGEHEAARLFGLTISTAAAKAVTFTTPALIALYSFYLARLWLKLDSALKPNKRLPTPLQYGLVVSLLSDSSLRSIISTARYLIRGHERRASASSILTHAMVMCSFIYVLTNIIGAVDLWLHVVTTTIVQPVTTMVETPFKYSVDQVVCKPYPDDWAHIWEPCLVFPGSWGNGVPSKAPGMLTRANNSDSLRTITLADADDMAVFVKPNVPQGLVFRATSFGARTSCESVNPSCDKEPVANCAGFPSTFPPIDGGSKSLSALQGGESQLFIQTSNCAWDASCDHVPPELEFFDRPPNEGGIAPINAYNFWMQFIWMAEGDQPYGVGSGSDAVGSYSNVATMLANCTLYFYNVTVDYKNGSYSLFHEELSNVGLSDGLALPARLGHLNSNLISNIEGRVFTDNSTESVMAFLQQDFTRLALGSAAVIANESTDTLLQGTLNNMIVGRYPLWPVLVFVGLMYTHAFLALILFLVTILPIRTGSLALTTRGEDNKKRVSVLELTQMRLHSPLPLVSALFPSSHAEADQGALSIETDELDMFDEKSNEGRIVAGLHSEGHSGQTQFGVHMIPVSNFDDSIIESKLQSATGYKYIY